MTQFLLYVLVLAALAGGGACHGLRCRYCKHTGCKENPGNDTCDIPEANRNASLTQFPYECVAMATGYDAANNSFFRIQFYCVEHHIQALACRNAHEDLSQTGTNVLFCCSSGDLCNANISDGPLPTTPTVATTLPALTSLGEQRPSWETPVAIALPSVVGVLFIITLIAFMRSRSWQVDRGRRGTSTRPLARRYDDDGDGDYYPEGSISVSAMENTASGEGLTLLAQETIARQIVLQRCIGKGRYGEVWHGKWKVSQDVAVKIFAAVHDRSYLHEVDIYSTTWLRHENVLGIIAADNRDDGMSTQFWMVTDYCHFGSLLDYITNPNVQLSVERALKLMTTAARGLDHLHTSVTGAVNSKPAMAHRDVKSRNFLVRRDGSACIADLGLAVRETDADMPWNSKKSLSAQSDMAFRHADKDSGTGSLGNARLSQAAATAANGFIAPPPFNYRVGTRRYMAPEILNETMRVERFDSFRRTDVYSFSLVLWEICRRTLLESGGGAGGAMSALEYEQPYQGLVAADPELEDMRQVVVVEQCRPLIPERWRASRFLSAVAAHVEESWWDDSQRRSSMTRLKRKLEALLEEALAARRASRDSTAPPPAVHAPIEELPVQRESHGDEEEPPSTTMTAQSPPSEARMAMIQDLAADD